MSSRRSNRPLAPTLGAVAVATLLAAAAFWQVTDGLRVVSTEGARRLDVALHPRALPDAILRQADGSIVDLAAALAHDRRTRIVTFVYTRCPSVCRAVGDELQQMQDRIHARGLEQRVRLLTISFDPADTDADLAAYGRRMRARRGVWDLYKVPDAGQRTRLLAAFGVTVIPAPLGEFVHNAAFHLLDRHGQLVRIVDYREPDAALALALALHSAGD